MRGCKWPVACFEDCDGVLAVKPRHRHALGNSTLAHAFGQLGKGFLDQAAQPDNGAVLVKTRMPILA